MDFPIRSPMLSSISFSTVLCIWTFRQIMRDTILRYRSSNTINIVIFKNLIVKNIVKNSLSNVSENLQQFEPKPQPEMYCHIFKNIDSHWFFITWLWFFSSVGATIARCKDPVRRAPRAPTERSKENFNGTRYILFFPRRCVAPLLSLSLSLCHEKVHVSWQTSALTVCRVHQDKSRWLEATGARWGKGYKKKKKKTTPKASGSW